MNVLTTSGLKNSRNYYLDKDTVDLYMSSQFFSIYFLPSHYRFILNHFLKASDISIGQSCKNISWRKIVSHDPAIYSHNIPGLTCPKAV